MTAPARISRRAALGLGLGEALRGRFDAAGPAPGPPPPPDPVDFGEGDSRAMGAHLLPAASALAARAEGERVLVVAAGDGHVPRAALASGAAVVAVERDPELLARGRDRVPEARWHAAAPASLPFGDASFDAVLAFFGATYVREPRVLARELTRVVRPGGAVALAAWAGASARLVDEAQSPGGPRPGAWSRYETAYRHFYGFDEFDVVEHVAPHPDGELAYCVISGRRA